MNRLKCPACGRNQYTSKDEAEGCIYCVYKGPLENMGPAGVEKANLEQGIAYFEDAIRESESGESRRQEPYTADGTTEASTTHHRVG